MTVHAESVKASIASQFLASLALLGKTEDWTAGGASPDILTDLKREGHITDHLYIAGCRLVHDMTRWHGNSMGLIAAYGDQIDGVKGSRLPNSYGGDLDAFRRMERVLKLLRAHERTLLQHCILSRQEKRGSLADWGRLASGYETRKTAYACAAGQVRSMLESIAEIYKLHLHDPAA